MLSWAKALGARVEHEWARESHSLEAFLHIAEDCLRSETHRAMDLANDWRWLWALKSLPTQFDITNSFADPQLTLFSGPRFLINLNLWKAQPTSIHDHGFCGAGVVLRGRSFQVTYTSDEANLERVAPGVLSCRPLRVVETTLVEPGEIIRVPLGKAFIHQVYHLDDSGAFLELRTRNIGPSRGDHRPEQYAYSKGGLALLASEPSVAFSAKLQALRTLLEGPAPARERALASFLEAHSPREGLEALLAVARPTDLALVEKTLSRTQSSVFAAFVVEVLQEHFESIVSWARLDTIEQRSIAAALQSSSTVDEAFQCLRHLPPASLETVVNELVARRAIGLRLVLLASDVAGRFATDAT